ncbi:hypothetical protein KR222_004186 [Zaprionus bogoriensis]|nr:hypothetical protein KR222_004186 [Zaprionus bogoriensis]
MNFSWIVLMIFALIGVVASAKNCPVPFKLENNDCTAKRTIKGECPQGSTYKINVNKCVYN